IMWVLRKTTNDEKLLQILEARYNENKDNPKKVSGFAARLQAMQQMQKQQQEEMRNKRANLNNKKNNLGK
nr:membrane protein insertase YidC [Prevotella sp.]